jgi:preprotein translocase subunit SecG
MHMFVVALHVLLCLFLILIILLQPGKGGDVGAAFGGGGGAGSVFGPRGPANLLQQATTVVAVMFMGTSITLAYYSSQKMLSNANVGDELLRLQQEQIERLEADKEKEPAPVEALFEESD